jgi:hypothetical protein
LGQETINEKDMDKKLVKVILIVVAVIGLLAIIGFLGMGMMMGRWAC